MNAKILTVTMMCASILIPAFSVIADQGTVVSVNGKVSAPAAENAESAPKKPTIKVLEPDKFFSFRSLDRDNHYEATLFVASRIEFELGADFKRKAYWNIDSYDPSICQLTLRHVPEGILDFRGDRTRFKLTALKSGYTAVVLSREGKKFIVHLIVK